MKWLKPEFWTFVVGAVVVVLNEKFGWGLSQESVIAFFATVCGYLLQQGIVNIKRGQPGLSINSRKLIFTLVGALFIGLNEVMQLGFSQEVIWSVAALVTGYNAIEGAKDAKEADLPPPEPIEVNLPPLRGEKKASPIGFGLHDDNADEQSH